MHCREHAGIHARSIIINNTLHKDTNKLILVITMIISPKIK